MKRIKSTKKSIIFVFLTALLVVFALSVSATEYNYNDFQFPPPDSSFGYTSVTYSGDISYGNSSNFLFSSLILEGRDYESNLVSFAISNVEAFQNRYSQYSFSQFIMELEDEYFSYENQSAYALLNIFNFYLHEAGYLNIINYSPPSASSVWAEVDSTINTWYTSIDGLIYEPITITSQSSLNIFLTDNVSHFFDVSTSQAYQNGVDSQNAVIQELQQQVDGIPQLQEKSYITGYNDGIKEGDSLKEGALTIVSAPMYILGNMLDFEVFGINLFRFVMSLLTVVIIAFVIKKISN